MIEDTS